MKTSFCDIIFYILIAILIGFAFSLFYKHKSYMIEGYGGHGGGGHSHGGGGHGHGGGGHGHGGGGHGGGGHGHGGGRHGGGIFKHYGYGYGGYGQDNNGWWWDRYYTVPVVYIEPATLTWYQQFMIYLRSIFYA